MYLLLYIITKVSRLVLPMRNLSMVQCIYITKLRCDDDAINVVCLYFQNEYISIDSENIKHFLVVTSYKHVRVM